MEKNTLRLVVGIVAIAIVFFLSIALFWIAFVAADTRDFEGQIVSAEDYERLRTLRQMEVWEIGDIEAEVKGRILVAERWGEEEKAKVRANVQKEIDAVIAAGKWELAIVKHCNENWDGVVPVIDDWYGWENACIEWCYTEKIPEVCGFEDDVFVWLLENEGYNVPK